MAIIEPFEKYTDEYDEWFKQHRDLFEAELSAIRRFIPDTRAKGMEVGVGSAQFAQPLAITMGVEPSAQMARRAKRRGVQVCLAVAEELPFLDRVFDFVLMVTTICFVDDVQQSFQEAYRVLKPGGFFVVGFVDKESRLGREYQGKKQQSRFYKDATFFSVPEVRSYFHKTGFKALQTRQTLISSMPTKVILDGYGKGSFVVIKGVKNQEAVGFRDS